MARNEVEPCRCIVPYHYNISSSICHVRRCNTIPRKPQEPCRCTVLIGGRSLSTFNNRPSANAQSGKSMSLAAGRECQSGPMLEAEPVQKLSFMEIVF